MRSFLTNNTTVGTLIGAGVLVRSSSRPPKNGFALITKDVNGRICVGGIGSFNHTNLPKLYGSDALKEVGH